jgi:Arc/MetJ-type ribon-helix-helix transcriptional regulator
MVALGGVEVVHLTRSCGENDGSASIPLLCRSERVREALDLLTQQHRLANKFIPTGMVALGGVEVVHLTRSCGENDGSASIPLLCRSERVREALDRLTQEYRLANKFTPTGMVALGCVEVFHLTRSCGENDGSASIPLLCRSELVREALDRLTQQHRLANKFTPTRDHRY